MSERVKLQVTEASEPKEVGQKGARKLSFKAKTPDGKELSYFTFKTSLFDMIKVNVSLDAEVEVKTREHEGNTYVDRQISQLFIDGQPVGGTRSQWQPRGESPEQRASIEAQVAVKTIAELRMADKLSEDSAEYKAMLGWCGERLKVKLPITSSPSAAGEQNAPPAEKRSARAAAQTKPGAVGIHIPEDGNLANTLKESPIDLVWLKESLKALQAKGLKAWGNREVVTYLDTITGYKSKDVVEAVTWLTKEQAAKFEAKIKDAIKLA